MGEPPTRPEFPGILQQLGQMKYLTNLCLQDYRTRPSIGWNSPKFWSEENHKNKMLRLGPCGQGAKNLFALKPIG